MTKKGQNTSKKDKLEILIVIWTEFWGINLILFPDIVTVVRPLNKNMEEIFILEGTVKPF